MLAASQPSSKEIISTRDPQGQSYTYEVERELLSSLPRQVRRTPLTIAIRWLLWILLAGCLCVMAYFGQRNLQNLDALLQHGRTAQAKVTGKYTTTDIEGTHYVLTYTFRTADGLVRSGGMGVSRAAYDKAKDGEPATTVTYLPSSHGQIWQVGIVIAKEKESWKRGWIIVALVHTGLWCVFIGICEWNWKRQLWLLQNGIAVIGQVTQGKVTPGGKGQPHYDLFYQFQLGSELISRTARVGKSIYQKYTQGGNPFLTVLYDPTKPRNSRPYFLLKSVQLDSR